MMGETKMPWSCVPIEPGNIELKYLSSFCKWEAKAQIFQPFPKLYGYYRQNTTLDYHSLFVSTHVVETQLTVLCSSTTITAMKVPDAVTYNPRCPWCVHPLDAAVPGIPHLHHANPQFSLCPLAFPYMPPRGKPQFHRLASHYGPQSRERGAHDRVPDNPVQPDSHAGPRCRPESPIPVSANDSAARWLGGQMTGPWSEANRCSS